MALNPYSYYLSLGSNLGDRENYLLTALEYLQQEEFRLLRLSSLYETPPWGQTNQASFFNACCCFHSYLDPETFLLHTQEIEDRLHRQRLCKWGPRTLDIDILYIEIDSSAVNYSSPRLEVPHPFLTERSFVLIPLAEIAPYLVIKGENVAYWQNRLDSSFIEKQPPSQRWLTLQKNRSNKISRFF